MISANQKRETTLPENGTGDREARPKRWYVAMVRMHHERKVSERLGQMGIENFVPVQETVRQWSDRKKKITVPLIPMMVFVHADEQERKAVLTLPAVSRYLVLRGEHTPAVVPDAQMKHFRFMLDYSEELISMSNAPLSRGEQVRVIKGPLAGLEGELVQVEGKNKIVVRLHVLGCACVDMAAGFVAPVNKKKE